MISNIIYAVILVLVAVPSWQIGTIQLDKVTITHKLEEQANNINRYNYSDKLAKDNVRDYLENKGLPTQFTYQQISEDKVRITYQYHGVATVFGYTYYQTSEMLSGETAE